MATVDPEFAREIPPLQDEEKRQLEESLLEEGCRDPIIIWQGTILDGHNRHEICTRLGLEYLTRAAPTSVETREDALDYMRRLQLGRRNLTPADFTTLLGRRYNATKGEHGGERASGQTVQLTAAEKIGEEHGVDERTVRRAGKLVEAMEQVEATEPEIVAKGRDEILKRAKELRKEASPATPSKPAAPGKEGQLLLKLVALVEEAYKEGYDDGENHHSITWPKTVAKRRVDELLGELLKAKGPE